MMTQREAAQRWGIPWTTFRRALKAGKVSVGEDKRVDPSEMLRVFGAPSARAETGTNGSNGTSLEPLEKRDPETFYRHNEALMKAQIEMLKVERDGLRELIHARDAHLADLRAELLRLTHDGHPRRRWWPWGKA